MELLYIHNYLEERRNSVAAVLRVVGIVEFVVGIEVVCIGVVQMEEKRNCVVDVSEFVVDIAVVEACADNSYRREADLLVHCIDHSSWKLEQSAEEWIVEEYNSYLNLKCIPLGQMVSVLHPASIPSSFLHSCIDCLAVDAVGIEVDNREDKNAVGVVAAVLHAKHCQTNYPKKTSFFCIGQKAKRRDSQKTMRIFK